MGHLIEWLRMLSKRQGRFNYKNIVAKEYYVRDRGSDEAAPAVLQQHQVRVLTTPAVGLCSP